MQSCERLQLADHNMQRQLLIKLPSFSMRLGFGNAVRLQSSPKDQGQATEDWTSVNSYSTVGLQLLDSTPTLQADCFWLRRSSLLLHRHILVQKPPATSHPPHKSPYDEQRRQRLSSNLPLRRATHSISFTGGSGRYFAFPQRTLLLLLLQPP